MKLHTFSAPEKFQNRLIIKVDGQELLYFEIIESKVTLNFRGKKTEYIDSGHVYTNIEPTNTVQFYSDIITLNEYLNVFQFNGYTEKDYDTFLSGLQGTIERYLDIIYIKDHIAIKKIQSELSI